MIQGFFDTVEKYFFVIVHTIDHISQLFDDFQRFRQVLFLVFVVRVDYIDDETKTKTKANQWTYFSIIE